MAQTIETLIEDDFLHTLQSLAIITKKGMFGPQRGIHSALHRGEGLEFLDYRKYQPGDDLRYVDWNVYGRLNKLFIKLFYAEENQTVHVLMDMSNSMNIGNPSKALVVKRIVAALGFIFLVNFDKLYISYFNKELNLETAKFNGKKNYPRFLHYLLSLKPESTTNFNLSMEQYIKKHGKRGIIIILSDLMDPKGYKSGLKALAQKNYSISLLQILDISEISPSLNGNILFREVETGETKSIFINSSIKEKYIKLSEQYRNNIKTFCLHSGIEFFTYSTDKSLEQTFIHFVTNSTLFK